MTKNRIEQLESDLTSQAQTVMDLKQDLEDGEPCDQEYNEALSEYHNIKDELQIERNKSDWPF